MSDKSCKRPCERKAAECATRREFGGYRIARWSELMAPSRVDSSFSAEGMGFAGCGGGEGEGDGDGAEEEEGADELSLGRATERRATRWCCCSGCGWGW